MKFGRAPAIHKIRQVITSTISDGVCFGERRRGALMEAREPRAPAERERAWCEHGDVAVEDVDRVRVGGV
jgi:hypothetical protein